MADDWRPMKVWMFADKDHQASTAEGSTTLINRTRYALSTERGVPCCDNPLIALAEGSGATCARVAVFEYNCAREKPPVTYATNFLVTHLVRAEKLLWEYMYAEARQTLSLDEYSTKLTEDVRCRTRDALDCMRKNAGRKPWNHCTGVGDEYAWNQLWAYSVRVQQTDPESELPYKLQMLAAGASPPTEMRHHARDAFIAFAKASEKLNAPLKGRLDAKLRVLLGVKDTE